MRASFQQGVLITFAACLQEFFLSISFGFFLKLLLLQTEFKSKLLKIFRKQLKNRYYDCYAES